MPGDTTCALFGELRDVVEVPLVGRGWLGWFGWCGEVRLVRLVG